MNKEARGVTVCCLCGDEGFSDKLFRCVRCSFRFQHKYCGNYYEDNNTASEVLGVCEWCRSEDRKSGKQKKPTGKDPSAASKPASRSEYCSSQKIKQNQGTDNEGGRSGGVKGKNGGTASSSSGKSGSRRYKLLKDVMC